MLQRPPTTYTPGPKPYPPFSPPSMQPHIHEADAAEATNQAAILVKAGREEDIRAYVADKGKVRPMWQTRAR